MSENQRTIEQQIDIYRRNAATYRSDYRIGSAQSLWLWRQAVERAEEAEAVAAGLGALGSFMRALGAGA